MWLDVRLCQRVTVVKLIINPLFPPKTFLILQRERTTAGNWPTVHELCSANCKKQNSAYFLSSSGVKTVHIETNYLLNFSFAFFINPTRLLDGRESFIFMYTREAVACTQSFSRVFFFQDTFNSPIYQRSQCACAGVVLCWLYRPSPRDARSKPG